MTKEEIEIIIKQAIKEAREETKKEITLQVKLMTDIDPTTDDGIKKIKSTFLWAKSGNENCEKTWEVAKEICIKTFIISFMTVIGYGVAVVIKRISGG